MNSDLEDHCAVVRLRLLEGKVIPFLGAGASLCGRPAGVDPFQSPYMPSAEELAAYLAGEYRYPRDEKKKDLTRVAQYVQAIIGAPPLYEALRRIFNRDAEPTALHRMLAEVPGLMRGQGAPAAGLLIVTTNYDDLVEHAFNVAGEPLDVVVYVAKGELHGKFVHRPPEGGERVIEQPNRYRELQPRRRTVLLKLHGAINRQNAQGDSFVITEDHYIDYLAQTDIANLVPATLMAHMNEAHFLFLGYGLADWNLRVILHRIWGQQPFDSRVMSWAVQKSPSKLEGLLWNHRKVAILDVDLLDYAETLGSLLAQAHDEPRTR